MPNDKTFDKSGSAQRRLCASIVCKQFETMRSTTLLSRICDYDFCCCVSVLHESNADRCAFASKTCKHVLHFLFGTNRRGDSSRCFNHSYRNSQKCRRPRLYRRSHQTFRNNASNNKIIRVWLDLFKRWLRELSRNSFVDVGLHKLAQIGRMINRLRKSLRKFVI